MHKTLRALPSLDFLRGFEAAGRRLSFTLAAAELFVTQSALSRQIKALEDALGTTLFERRHRALALTPAGAQFHRAITDALAAVAGAADPAHGATSAPGVTLSTTVAFASLWIIPRLSRFRAAHPEVEVYVSADDRVVDLARGDVDVAIRYQADAAAPAGALKLFGERMTPVASPKVLRRGSTPLARSTDLARHVLLHLDDPEGRMPWLDWNSWLASNGAAGLKPAGSLRFTLYDQVIQAAVGGQGVALGRIPILAEHLRDGRLIAPFAQRYDSARGYFAIVAPRAGDRPDVAAFVEWLRHEAGREGDRGGVRAPPRGASRNPPPARRTGARARSAAK